MFSKGWKLKQFAIVKCDKLMRIHVTFHNLSDNS